QGRAIQELHDDKGMPLLLPDVINRADIWVIQRRSGFCLTLKAAEGLCIFSHLVRQELERDEAVQASVLSFVHNTHATTAELFDNAVVRDDLANDLGRGSHWREC